MPEQRDILEAAHAGLMQDPQNPAMKKGFLDAAQPTIDKALRNYAPGMEDNMRLHAQIKTLDIAKQYNPNKGMSLNTYIMQNLHQVSREAKKRANPVKLPEKHVLDRNYLANVERDYINSNGKEPTAAELSDLSGMSIKRIERARGVNQLPESALMTEEGDSLFKQGYDPQKAWADYVYQDLDRLDQKIFEWSTGYGGAKTMKKNEIATKLKISAPAVSQRIGKIIKKLEEGERYA